MVDAITNKAAVANIAHRAPASTTGASGAIAIARAERLPKPAVANLPAPVLSHEAAGLARDMAASSPIDMARVADVKARMDAGLYKVDPARIADAMLTHELGTRKARQDF